MILYSATVQKFIYDVEKITTNFMSHATTDSSFKGIKKMYKGNKNEACNRADEIIKNTYRVLLTRGKNGCFIYCVDSNLNNYFKNIVSQYSDKKIRKIF